MYECPDNEWINEWKIPQNSLQIGLLLNCNVLIGTSFKQAFLENFALLLFVKESSKLHWLWFIIGSNLVLNLEVFSSIDFFGNSAYFGGRHRSTCLLCFSTIFFQLQKVAHGTFRCIMQHPTAWLLSGILLVVVCRNTESLISLQRVKAMNKR